MSENTSREVRLKTRPVGLPKESDFELAEVTVGAPGEDEVLIRNLYMSVDPYMRGRMIDRKSYATPFEVGAVMHGGAVGEVVESRADGFQVGDHVLSMNGWRERFLSSGDTLRKVDGNLAPLSAYLGVLGMPGLTAYIGLEDIGKPEPGQTVFVSGAAGAVGSAACQLAMAKGCRVVGSAGSEEKVDWLQNEAGVDVALNYKTVGNLQTALLEACPDGIDIYFENVGGAVTRAVAPLLNPGARVPICGFVSAYNAEDMGSVETPFHVLKALDPVPEHRFFLVTEWQDKHQEITNILADRVASGELKYRETIAEGLENAPEAFKGMLKGKNFGKQLVHIAD